MRKKRGILFSAALLLLSLLAGCGNFQTVSKEEIPVEHAVLSPEYAALYREVAKASPFIGSLDGYADVWIKTPKRKDRLFCNIQLNRGKDARMIVSSGLLNWPVADMFFRKDSLFVHDMLNNRLFLGSNSDRNIEKMLGVNSGYRLLSETLLGLVRITEPESAIKSVRKGSGKLLFTIGTPSGTKEVIIDPSNKTLSALILRNSSGSAKTELHFRDFEMCRVEGRSVLVPKKIEMILYRDSDQGGNENQLVIAYDERVLKSVSIPLKFSMPKKARVISLDDARVLPWM
ncbi:MAG: DUF4292 domain-containing protein [Chlorobium sp.]|nr:MAG: DUF4292 domain-containing protein [Chlorobium sp.]